MNLRLSKAVVGIFLLCMSIEAMAADRIYCSSTDIASKPYHQFVAEITMTSGLKYEAIAKAKLFAAPLPFFGAEIAVVPSEIEGCESALVWNNEDLEEDAKAGYYFECAADGDAGFGTLEKVGAGYKGTVSFPEGQNLGIYQVDLDTEIPVTCYTTREPV